MANTKVSQGHSIYIYDDELPFVEEILEVKGIDKDSLDKEQNILTLSVSYLGFIKTPRRIIEIMPKHEGVNFNHILRIYFFVHGSFKNFNDELFSLADATLGFDLIKLFLNEMEPIVKKGLPTEYVSSQENLRYSSGNVDYPKTYKNILLNRQEPFVSNKDDLSLQTPLNKTLKAAFNKIQNFIEDKGSVSYIQKYLSNISDSFTPQDLKNVLINTKNYYCKNAYLYAKLILEESHYDTLGGFGGESFLINGDMLFEQFIKKILFTYTNDRYFLDWNMEKEYGIYGHFPKSYKPDVLYKYETKENKALGIIDVKNKFGTIYKNADVYQMLFYSGMLSSQKIILCYPSTYRRKPETLEIFSENFITTKIYAVFINICEESREGFINSINEFIEDMYYTITK